MVSQCGNRGRWKQQSERVCSLRNDDDDDDEDGDDDDDDDDGNDDGLPAYSHQVGMCHYDKGWENDKVPLPPCINLSSIYR